MAAAAAGGAAGAAAETKSLPLVAVVGATGQQGGSVVDWLLRDRAADGSARFRVRALTRSATGEKAKSLADRGCEVVACDLSKPATLQTAFKGAQYVFAVTNFWDPEMKKTSPETDALGAKYGGPASNPFYIAALNEELQGRAIYDAAVQQGVQCVIWSGLPDAKTISKNKFEVYHFTMKSHVEAYARSLKDKIASIYVYACVYGTFLSSFAAPKDDATGGGQTIYSPFAPSTMLPVFDPADTGYYVSKLLANPQAWNQKIVVMAGSLLSMDDFATTFMKASGKFTKHQQITWDKFQVPWNSAELLEMFHYFDECQYYDHNEIRASMKLFPAATSFEAVLLRAELAKAKAPAPAAGAAAASAAASAH